MDDDSYKEINPEENLSAIGNDAKDVLEAEGYDVSIHRSRATGEIKPPIGATSAKFLMDVEIYENESKEEWIERFEKRIEHAESEIARDLMDKDDAFFLGDKRAAIADSVAHNALVVLIYRYMDMLEITEEEEKGELSFTLPQPIREKLSQRRLKIPSDPVGSVGEGGNE